MDLEWLECVAMLLEMVGTPSRLPCVPQTTGWSLTDEAIVVRNGPIHRTIPLKYIESIRPLRISHSSGKSNAGRLRVSYRCRPRVTESLEIASADAEGFMKELESRCGWLLAEDAGLVRKEPLPTPTYLAPPKRIDFPGEPHLEQAKTGGMFWARCDAESVRARALVLCLAACTLLILFLNQISGANTYLVIAICALSGILGSVVCQRRLACETVNESGQIHALNESGLIVRFGKRDLTIPIHQIDEIYPEVAGRTWKSSTVSHSDICWCRDQLRVSYWDEACRELLSVYVEPNSREEFLKSLQQLNPHLARRGDVLFRTNGEE